MESFSDKLCFARQGDYYSLKKFFKDEIKLDGVWERPGGDKKKYSLRLISLSPVVITRMCCILQGMRRAKTQSYFVQKSARAYALKLDRISQTERATSLSTNCQDNDVDSDIGDLRSGQELNSLAIQSLSHNVKHLTEVISQVRKELKNNEQY